MPVDSMVRDLQPNVLIVDDSPENLDVLTAILDGKGYALRPVTSGRAALRSIRTFTPDIILLDIVMSDMDGIELCGRIKSNRLLKDIPVIFISARHEALEKVQAFAVGGVDYVTKPFQPEEVIARVDTHLKLRRLQIELKQHNLNLEDLVRQKIREISESQMATIFALANLAESRDDDTGRHLERVRILCRILSEWLSRLGKFSAEITPQFLENIENACPLHDIGKVGIPDSILLKRQKLTDEEFEAMKRHTVIGADTLRRVHDQYSKNAFIVMGIEIAGHHHERWDGRGYPDGLAGEAIPLCARIVSIVDAYDAMRSKRCYKEPRPHAEAMAEIERGRAGQFDPDITSEFSDLGERIAVQWDQLEDEA